MFRQRTFRSASACEGVRRESERGKEREKESLLKLSQCVAAMGTLGLGLVVTEVAENTASEKNNKGVFFFFFSSIVVLVLLITC